jgi:hypothetical protein
LLSEARGSACSYIRGSACSAAYRSRPAIAS